MNRTEPHAIAQTASRHTLLRYARVWLIASLVVLGGAAWADPPGRVGAVSLVDGEAWMSDPTSSESFAPSINWPVSTGTTVETGMTSRVELRIGSSVVRLDGDTKLRFDRLDDAAIRMRLDHGTISVRHRNLDNALETTVVTAGGTVSFVETGRYRIDATDNGVSIAVMQGAARWDSPRASYGARTGLRMDIGYDGYARSTDIATDGFDDWVASRDRRDDRLAAPRYVSPEMTGYDTLDQDGVWQTTADYGPVWYPRVVVAGWAPYRYGRWVNYGAWGWTWVDDAPWGFAVSHYGRWAWLDGRWGWVPGAIVPRPVWAPALVAWAGGSNWSFSVSLGVPAVGWV
ncbi:MAG: FecR domain-containing protein, partial [Betaproteobacteria bacterium]|nr:FecR domain-containing protein [Betaproteobacteria bacterium]